MKITTSKFMSRACRSQKPENEYKMDQKENFHLMDLLQTVGHDEVDIEFNNHQFLLKTLNKDVITQLTPLFNQISLPIQINGNEIDISNDQYCLEEIESFIEKNPKQYSKLVTFADQNTPAILINDKKQQQDLVLASNVGMIMAPLEISNDDESSIHQVDDAFISEDDIKNTNQLKYESINNSIQQNVDSIKFEEPNYLNHQQHEQKTPAVLNVKKSFLESSKLNKLNIELEQQNSVQFLQADNAFISDENKAKEELPETSIQIRDVQSIYNDQESIFGKDQRKSVIKQNTEEHQLEKSEDEAFVSSLENEVKDEKIMENSICTKVVKSMRNLEDSVFQEQKSVQEDAFLNDTETRDSIVQSSIRIDKTSKDDLSKHSRQTSQLYKQTDQEDAMSSISEQIVPLENPILNTQTEIPFEKDQKVFLTQQPIFQSQKDDQKMSFRRINNELQILKQGQLFASVEISLNNFEFSDLAQKITMLTVDNRVINLENLGADYVTKKQVLMRILDKKRAILQKIDISSRLEQVKIVTNLGQKTFSMQNLFVKVNLSKNETSFFNGDILQAVVIVDLVETDLVQKLQIAKINVKIE